MGNRATLCLEKEFDENAVGVYLHWHGSRENIEQFLEITRIVMGERMGDVQYAKARLIQTIGNLIGGNLSLGIDFVKNLDYDNLDNGVYCIDMKELRITHHLER